MGRAPAAETSGGMGVGPGDMRRYLFIMGCEGSSPGADNSRSILEAIARDGYIMAQLIYKVLLSRGRSNRTGSPTRRVPLSSWIRFCPKSTPSPALRNWARVRRGSLPVLAVL